MNWRCKKCEKQAMEDNPTSSMGTRCQISYVLDPALKDLPYRGSIRKLATPQHPVGRTLDQLSKHLKAQG